MTRRSRGMPPGWRDLSADEETDIVADWTAAFASDHFWHNSYIPSTDSTACEEWARAVAAYGAVLARMRSLGIDVPDDRAAAFMTRLGRLWANATWSREQQAAFAATLTASRMPTARSSCSCPRRSCPTGRRPVRRRPFGPRHSVGRRT